MSSPEGLNEPPIWEDTFIDLIFAAEHSTIPSDAIVSAVSMACGELARSGALSGFGEVQAFLRSRGSSIQLTARPFVAEDLPQAGMRCIDIRTGEERGHWLMVSVRDGGLVDAWFRDRNLSHEQNEAILDRDTGFLAI